MMPSDTDKRRSAPLINIKKRSLLVLIGLFIFCTITYFFSPGNSEQCIDSPTSNPLSSDTSTTTTIIDAVQDLSSSATHSQVTFHNLNENDHNKEESVAIMVVLPPWAISPSLEDFFKQLAQQTHTATRLSLLILNPASPTTIYTVRHYLSSARLSCPVDLYTKTYDTLTPWIAHDDHHDTAHTAIYELAPLGKSAMARAKNFLVQSALAPTDRYVLWLDPLLTLFPTTLVADFVDQCKTESADILVPNTMIRKDGVEWGYDRSNWQETTMSTSLQDTVPVDFVFMEGWWEYDTHRFLMVDMISEEDPGHIFTKVSLDGVGSTCLFVKAEIHRNGLNFPAYPYQHQLDSEAFAKAAKVEGYTIVGLPNYKVYHADLDDTSGYSDSDNDSDSGRDDTSHEEDEEDAA